MLEVHIPKFARRWGSVGLFAEDAFESIHAMWNAIMRSCACIPDLIARNVTALKKLTMLQHKGTMAAGQAMQADRTARGKGKGRAV